MNREPPKNVYSNNRLKKIEPAAWPINNKRQSCHQYTSGASSRGMTGANISVDTKDRSLHFNKSQSKYEKHFEPLSSKASASQTQNEYSDVKKVLPNLKNPTTLGDLGIPLKHFYVQRKSTSSNRQFLQPVCKKSRKNLASSELPENLLSVSHEHSADNPLGIPLQESPNQLVETSNPNDPYNASEFFQMVKATLEDTFEEVVKDCPEFLTTTLNAKENLLKKLCSYTQRQQLVLGNHSTMEDMSTSGSDILFQSTHPEGFNRFHGEPSASHAFKPKLQLNDTTATTKATMNPWTPAAYCLKTYTTPREFLPRSRQYTGSVTNMSERMPSDTIQISSKGSSVRVNGSLSLSQTRCKNNVEETDDSTEASRPMLNPPQVPSFSLYPNAYRKWSGFL